MAAYLKRWLRPLPRRDATELIVLSQGLYMLTSFMIAAFRENWTIRFAQSHQEAVARVESGAHALMIHDWDHFPNAWREVCAACARNTVPFYLVATAPPDDLFLAVAVAGGTDVWWKPLTTERMIEAIRGARGACPVQHPGTIEPNRSRIPR